jgi:hypothetical protein
MKMEIGNFENGNLKSEIRSVLCGRGRVCQAQTEVCAAGVLASGIAR